MSEKEPFKSLADFYDRAEVGDSIVDGPVELDCVPNGWVRTVRTENGCVDSCFIPNIQKLGPEIAEAMNEAALRGPSHT